MDLIDKKILSLLDSDSRMQSSDIARKLRISRQVADYRIQQLSKKNILLHSVALVNPFQFVENIWHTYVKLQSLTAEKEKKIMQFFQKQKHVWWIARCQGEWDLIFSTAGNGIENVDSVLQEFENLFHENISEEQTTSLIRAVAFPRGYLTFKETAGQPYAVQEKKEQIDENDIKILKILAMDARMPSTGIARNTGLSPRQVIYRIKELRKKRIIQLFRIHLNIEQSGHDYYKVCFFAQNFTKEAERKVLGWCEKNPYTVYYTRKIAPWSFEIEFEAPSYKELNNILMDFRNVFGSMIKRTQTTIIIKEYKGELNILDLLD